MGKNNRVPLQVSDKFMQKLKELQRKIRMKTGNDTSLREITNIIATNSMFEELEKELLKSDITMDIKIKYDGRF